MHVISSKKDLSVARFDEFIRRVKRMENEQYKHVVFTLLFRITIFMNY